MPASGWHADATWQPRPPMGSILMCREAPPVGGGHLLLRTATACGKGCRKRSGSGSNIYRRSTSAASATRWMVLPPWPFTPSPEPTRRPGKPLSTSNRASCAGFAEETRRPRKTRRKALLWRMKLQEGRPEYTCRFGWEPGSIAMWDNRCVLHTASADFLAAPAVDGAADDPRLRPVAAHAVLRATRARSALTGRSGSPRCGRRHADDDRHGRCLGEL